MWTGLMKADTENVSLFENEIEVDFECGWRVSKYKTY